RADGREPATSARPPVLANPTTSEAARRIRIGAPLLTSEILCAAAEDEPRRHTMNHGAFTQRTPASAQRWAVQEETTCPPNRSLPPLTNASRAFERCSAT